MEKIKIEEYIEEEENQIKELKERLNEIDKKIIKFGTKSEQEFLTFLLPKKEFLLKEIIEFKKELFKFKE